MKKILYSLIALITVIGLSGCSNIDKELNGTWEASLPSQGATLTYTFDTENHSVNVDVKVAMEDVELATIKVKGKYSVSSDELIIDIDNEETDVELSDALIEASGLSGEELEPTKQEMLAQMAPNLENTIVNKVQSISDTELVLVENGTTVKFTKK